MVIFPETTGLRSIFKPNHKYLGVIIIAVSLLGLGCKKGEKIASSPKEALQQYLKCKNEKDIKCLRNMLPEMLSATARDAARDIIAAKKRVKTPETLGLLANEAYLDKELLKAGSGNDILFYAMDMKNKKSAGFVSDVRHSVKYVRCLNKKEGRYNALTYGGDLYEMKKDGNGRFRITPGIKVRRKINKAGASSALLLLLVNKTMAKKTRKK